MSSASVPTRANLVMAGTGFASTFFLHEYLKHARSDERIVVFERGARRDRAARLARPDRIWNDASASFVNQSREKPWIFTLGFGGSSNCWWACVPRFLPEDFALASRYGVGRDWPLSYAALEPFYEEVEASMAVAGPPETPFPRRRPYPEPPHRWSEVDERLAARFPGQVFVQPCARASRPLAQRPACCGSSVCDLCPVDAKFTIENSMRAVYDDPRVTLIENCSVTRLDVAGGRVAGVEWSGAAGQGTTRAELCVLGCNGLFNPWLLLRSGLEDAYVGRYLVEQVGVEAKLVFESRRVRLGSTSITGHGYMFYAGKHRRERPAALLEAYSAPGFSVREGRWAQEVTLKLILEDLPLRDSRVEISADDMRPVVTYAGPSDYLRRGVVETRSQFETIARAFPDARLEIVGPQQSEAHIIGTTVMSAHPSEGVVDPALVHHRVRNLLVLGSSTFPTAPPANPTLTLAALAVRAARLLFQPGGQRATP